MLLQITYKDKTYEKIVPVRSKSGIIKAIKANKNSIANELKLYVEANIAHIIVSKDNNIVFAGCIVRDVYKCRGMIILEPTDVEPAEHQWQELENKCKI